jgi:hypothetical protein
MPAAAAVGIYLNDAQFDAANIYASLYPATDRLVGVYTFGNSLALSLINEVDENNPIVAVGSPTIAANYATCSRTACFDSLKLSTLSRTFVAVARFPASGNAAWMGDYQNAMTPAGDAIGYVAAGTTIRNYVALTSTVSTVPQLAAASMSSSRFRVLIGTVDNAGLISGMTTWDDSGTLVASLSGLASRGAVSTRTIRLGACYDSATFTGTADIASAMIYNGVLSTAEQAAVRAMYQARYAATLGNTL